MVRGQEAALDPKAQLLQELEELEKMLQQVALGSMQPSRPLATPCRLRRSAPFSDAVQGRSRFHTPVLVARRESFGGAS